MCFTKVNPFKLLKLSIGLDFRVNSIFEWIENLNLEIISTSDLKHFCKLVESDIA